MEQRGRTKVRNKVSVLGDSGGRRLRRKRCTDDETFMRSGGGVMGTFVGFVL